MIEKSFDRKKMDVKVEEIIDRVNAFESIKQMIMLPPTILLTTVSKEESGILQVPSCYFARLSYWITSSVGKDRPKISVTISDRETNSTSSKTITLKEDFGTIEVDTKIPNQVLIECSTQDDVKVSICLFIYINDPRMWISDIITMKKLSELGEEL